MNHIEGEVREPNKAPTVKNSRGPAVEAEPTKREEPSSCKARGKEVTKWKSWQLSYGSRELFPRSGRPRRTKPVKNKPRQWKEERGWRRREGIWGGSKRWSGVGRYKEPKPKSPNLNTILQYFAILILPLLPSHIPPTPRILPFSSHHQQLFLSRARGHISFLPTRFLRVLISAFFMTLGFSLSFSTPSEQEAHPCFRKCWCSRTARPLYLLESSCYLPP